MQYNQQLIEVSEITFQVQPVLIFATIFPIVIGMILRVPKLMMEIKAEKEWTLNWIKLGAIGMPALYVAILPILSVTSFGMNFLFAKELILIENNILITTAGIVFGYVLLDSFKQ